MHTSNTCEGRGIQLILSKGVRPATESVRCIVDEWLNVESD